MGRNAKLKAERRKARALLDKRMTGMWITIGGVKMQYRPEDFGHDGRKMMRAKYLVSNRHQGVVRLADDADPAP